MQPLTLTQHKQHNIIINTALFLWVKIMNYL